jgi:hypothetical protein
MSHSIMTANDLIKALQENITDKDAPLTFNIKQENKAYGVLQLHVMKSDNDEPSYHKYTWINNSYGGSITLHLPDGTFITQRKK